MERAWVLINASSEDVAKELVDHISAIRGVRLVDLVRGQFSLLVAVQIRDEEDLAQAIEAIRQLEGVEQVQVCDVIASQRVMTTRDSDPGWP
ncbi:MAG: Lrp/AsnC ligand binding domain-containing protein [Chloroflexi bacterium]|nr:Lrp/AsnC ligand binding domain-containing protein [Chloroflexota bacterium]